ncbi:MAG: UvrD-helicase domain-containing protein [Desulfovibrio sp.]
MESRLHQVKAAAGSGKTFTLTGRFLSLLLAPEELEQQFVCSGKKLSGYDWPEILAATFTNKAAAEMKERVVSSLKDKALGEDISALCPYGTPTQATALLERILRRYHNLNIRTIDSLLNLLMRIFALELGVRPDFDIIFDEEDFYKDIYDRYIDKCEEEGGANAELLQEALDTMLSFERKDGFWLDESVRSRLLSLISYIYDFSGEITTDQEEIGSLMNSGATKLRLAATDLQKKADADTLPMSAHCKKLLAKCIALTGDERLPMNASKLAEKASFVECVNKKGKEDVNETHEILYRAFCDAFSTYRAEMTILNGAYAIAPSVQLASELACEILTSQQNSGQVLNRTVPSIVSHLLTNTYAVPDAYCRLGGRLHHMLIDEFQDTGRDQWNAISPLAEECLSKGGSLFYVGDVKQAIYGWRGGDSELFDQVIEQPDLVNIAAESEQQTLEHNWRSCEEVVKFNNSTFELLTDPKKAYTIASLLMKDADSDLLDDFTKSLTETFEGCSQQVANIGSGGYVQVNKIEVAGKTAKDREMINTQTLDVFRANVKEISSRRPYGDIAVLVRSATDADAVCDELIQMGIPVITESSLLLAKHPVIRQIVALLHFVDYPMDNLAFAEFISGQELFLNETGLASGDVYDWLSQQSGAFYVSFRKEFPEIWDKFISPFHNKSGLMSPYDLAREAARCFRVRERFPDADLYLMRFFEVIHLAEQRGYSTLPTFLHLWDNEKEKEKVPLPEHIDAVRIMTIHKSKGLEFPVVIVPFHHWKVRSDRDYIDVNLRGKRMITSLRKDIGRPYYERISKTFLEQLNLLYVAWTRPREELYLTFPDMEDSSSAVQTALQHLIPFPETEAELEETISDITEEPSEKPAEQDGLPVHTLEFGSLNATDTISQVDQAPDTAVDLPQQETLPRLMEWLPRMRVYRHSLEEVGHENRLRGEAAHLAMEYLRHGQDMDMEIARATAMALEQFPSLSHIAEELSTQIISMLQWFCAQTKLLAYHKDGIAEAEFLDAAGNTHRVDHLYLSSTESIVLEYKTGAEKPEHQTQVRRYLKLLQAAEQTAHTKLKGYIIYLDKKSIAEVER